MSARFIIGQVVVLLCASIFSPLNQCHKKTNAFCINPSTAGDCTDKQTAQEDCLNDTIQHKQERPNLNLDFSDTAAILVTSQSSSAQYPPIMYGEVFSQPFSIPPNKLFLANNILIV